jgi:hypothetical protein
MPIDQAKLDELTTLLVDQMLFEFRTAATEKKALDPRRLAAAQKLLEAADARTIKPAEKPVTIKKAPEGTSDDTGDETEIQVPSCYATKSIRDRMRRLAPTMPNMKERDYLILNSFAEADGAELLEPPPTKEITS